MVRNKFIKSSALPVCLLSATLAFGVSPIYNKVYAGTMTAQQAHTIKGKVIDSNGEPVIGATKIYELLVPIKDSEGNVLENLKLEQVPYEIYIPTAPDGKKGVYPNFDCETNSILVFSVNFETPSGDNVSTVHTFVPHFEWDYDQFYEDYHLGVYPNVTVDINN